MEICHLYFDDRLDTYYVLIYYMEKWRYKNAQCNPFDE